MRMEKIENISTDLLIILIWTVSTVIFIFAPLLKDSFIRNILGIPTILFIPGYVLISSLFPKKNDLDIIERIILSLGMSVVVVSLIGLGLNYTFGIRLIPIMISLTIFDILMSFIASHRRGLLAEDQTFNIHFRVIYNSFIAKINSQTKTEKILTIVLIFFTVASICMLIYVVAIHKTGEKFTEFYILNSTGNADNYTKDLKIDSPSSLLVGVINHEYSPVNYTIQIDIDKNILLNKEIELNTNETWENNITFVPNKEGNYMKLEFLLFKNKNFTEPYRELHLWENITR